MHKPVFTCAFLAVLGLCFLLPQNLAAHFGAVLPEHSLLQQRQKQTDVSFAFLHPFEQQGMELDKPLGVKVIHMGSGQSRSLTEDLQPTQLLGHQAWTTTFQPRRPGVFCLTMEPKPYWEEAEDIFIKHLTKTYIAAFGQENGWTKPLNLETEIVPLTRPFGLYSGNVFQGRVMLDQEPVPGAEVEVEFYNQNKQAEAQSPYMVTQVVTADENGVFTYAAPKAGWWGFSALNQADYTLEHQGEEKNVELGAVIWVQFLPWQ
jgi:cobalt/nickel transport protein